MGSDLRSSEMASTALMEAKSPSMPTTDARPPAVEAQQLRSPGGSTFKPGWQVQIPSYS